PRVDTSGTGAGSSLQLNGIPVPFRIKGNWMSPGLTPDTAMIQSILRQDAGNRIGEQIGGDAGNIIGEIIGGGNRPAPATGETITPPRST
ncbi:MAG: hypothetical protein MRY64_06385, partial [Hyphomonadaceae bacterium]|nr:hypothetical protein [Hyphomonadaceae bacterium]